MTQHGFTLVELLVVIAVLAVVLAFSLPSFNDFTKSQYLTQAAEQVLGDLRSAQSRAQNGVVDGSKECWGLVMVAGQAYYKVGSVDCSLACASFDAAQLGSSRTLNFSGVVQASNNAGVIFSKISGLPKCPIVFPATLTLQLDASTTKSVKIEAGGNMYVQ